MPFVSLFTPAIAQDASTSSKRWRPASASNTSKAGCCRSSSTARSWKCAASDRARCTSWPATPRRCRCGPSMRNMVLRSDAIIKAPSNDPFTALAIARTMIEMAPVHPLTKHVSVAYWKGGDTAFEERLYQPQNIEKIVAWGGFASLKHVTRYVQPGLELISLDPKRSASIIGAETFETEETMREAAVRLATDVGVLNQKSCICARVVYAQSGTDEDGVRKLADFGRMVHEAMLKLPNSVSTAAKRYDAGLKAEVDALRLDDEWYEGDRRRASGGRRHRVEDPGGGVLLHEARRPHRLPLRAGS
ncbi:acyl-CoA reductase [Variovorax rhizosphaerae]|uniref:Acyl-CoA reductase n=1 Tax=Variovorax rhizosphaerae TaxID=1836200 RepID=A0ABU8WW41_9BURK